MFKFRVTIIVKNKDTFFSLNRTKQIKKNKIFVKIKRLSEKMFILNSQS